MVSSLRRKNPQLSKYFVNSTKNIVLIFWNQTSEFIRRGAVAELFVCWPNELWIFLFFFKLVGEFPEPEENDDIDCWLDVWLFAKALK